MVGSVYCVGGTYKEFLYPGTLIRAEYDNVAWSLIVGFEHITPDEIRNFRSGNFSFNFAVIDGVLFIFFKFGAIPWMDTPFDPRLYPTPRDFEVSFQTGDGAPLLVYIVDSATGKLHAMREIGLGQTVSAHLYEVCRQLIHSGPLDGEKYQDTVQRIYQQYPTSEAMLPAANPQDAFFIADIH